MVYKIHFMELLASENGGIFTPSSNWINSTYPTDNWSFDPLDSSDTRFVPEFVVKPIYFLQLYPQPPSDAGVLVAEKRQPPIIVRG